MPALRWATPDDAAEVARLLHDFNTEFDVASPGPAVLAERLARLLADRAMVAIVVAGDAGAEGTLVAVGLVSLRPNVWYEGNVALLDELYVIPARRNEGIGTAVLSFLDAGADELGVDAIEINVDEGDLDAQRFYARHGYSSADPETGERAFYFYRELSRGN